MVAADSTTEELLHNMEVPWQSYLPSGIITDRELQLVRRLDKASAETQASLLASDGPAYADLLLSLLSKITSQEDTVLYTLCLLEQILGQDRANVEHFHASAAASAGCDALYGPLLRLLQRPQWGVQERAGLAMSKIVASRPDRASCRPIGGAEATDEAPPAHAGPAHAALNALVDFFASQLASPSNATRSVPMACKGLATLLAEPAARQMFLRADGVAKLSTHLKGAGSQRSSMDKGGTDRANIQMQYEGGLCLWLLTYEAGAADALGSTPCLLALIALLKGMAKEKVVRVAALALQQLAITKAAELVALGLPKAVAAAQLHTWADEDLVEALESLRETLAITASTMSSFEAYRRQLLSGALTWGARHEDDRFWRENAGRFEEEDYGLLRVLLALMGTARDTDTLAVAAHDLGKFVEHYPAGRNIIQALKGKEVVMQLMQHADADVKKHALLCTQKLLVHKWSLMQLSTE